MVPNLQQEGLLHLQAIDCFPKVMKGVLHELKCVAITPPTHTHTLGSSRARLINSTSSRLGTGQELP